MAALWRNYWKIVLKGTGERYWDCKYLTDYAKNQKKRR
jgi:hypothetical protein